VKMNKNIILTILFSSTFLLIRNQENNATTKHIDSPKQSIYFNLNDEKLIDIVNRLAAHKQINIIWPANQQKLNETTVTFKVPHKIQISEAWEMTIMMLDIAGFSVIKTSNTLYKIETNTIVGKQPAPLYINVSSEVLPNTSRIIRYLYYFQNIFLKENGVNDNIGKILTDMLPMQNANQNFYLDNNYNSMMITAPANIVKGIINIMHELDQSGFREAIEVFPISHTTAEEIVSTIDKLIPQKKGGDQFRFPPQVAEPSEESKTYFSSSTRIVPITQTNSVAIFGLYESVQRVKDFIKKYLDKKVDAEKSVLHFKPLEHLKAGPFATTLTELIKGVAEQSTAEKKGRLLEKVVIVAEEEVVAEEKPQRELVAGAKDIGTKLDEPKDGKRGKIIGGNNLIIACNQKEWKIINDLITLLDIEQWQVAIEVLIVDMNIESSNQLGTQLRRISNDANSDAFKWQTAQIERPLLDYTDTSLTEPTNKIDSTTGLESDLLSQQAPVVESSEGGKPFNIASNATPGSTILSFKSDNGMAAILKLLRKFNDAKILSQPFIIARNNEQANILDLETRMVKGSAIPQSVGGSAIIKYEAMDAATKVGILPRISGGRDNINLEIQISANEFMGPQEIRKRNIVTNANIGNKEVLVLGGISKLQIDDSLNETPILSRIPIIGYLFKQQTVKHDQRNLMIFISPCLLNPVSSKKHVSKFTSQKIDLLSKKLKKDSTYFGCPKEYVKKHENFQCLEDPITNFLFHPEEGGWLSKTLENYVDRGIWTQAVLNPKKKSKSIIEKKSQTKKKKGNTNDKPKADKLKKLLKDQENPLKSKS